MKIKDKYLLGSYSGLLCISGILLFAFIFVLVFSSSTSPLYDKGAFGDSAMFQVIGRGWTEGAIPYRDLWDSKGPFVFLVNALGYVLCGSPAGVCLVQCVFMSATLLVIYSWLSSYYDRLKAVAASIGVAFFLVQTYECGNLTEEYLLPPLTLSFWFLYRWSLRASSGIYAHNAWHSAVYGIVAGLSLMTRATNAVGVGAGALFVLAVLVYKGMWRNILLNVAAFFSGLAAVVLPFHIYFYAQSAVGEMWYASVVYNFSYYSSSASGSMDGGFMYTMFRLSCCFVLLAASALCLYGKQFLRGFMWLVVALSTSAYLFMTYGFQHYGMIALPYLCIFLCELRNAYVHGAALRRLSYCLMAALASFILINNILNTSARLSGQNDSYKYMTECIGDGYRKNFIAYNCDAGIYINYGLTPCCRFFSVQDWAVKNDVCMKKSLIDGFSSCNAEWLLIEGDLKTALVRDIIAGKYELVRHNPGSEMRLYRLKQVLH